MLLLLILFFLLMGALGVVDEQTCANLVRENAEVAEVVGCYKQAAITLAHLCKESSCPEAVNVCRRMNQVVHNYLQSMGAGEDDRVLYLNIHTTDCYSRVAEISGDVSVCELVDKGQSDPFSSYKTMKERCIAKAQRRAQLSPYTSNFFKNSICSLLFLFPPLLYAFLRSK